jgi:hypothetical protein
MKEVGLKKSKIHVRSLNLSAMNVFVTELWKQNFWVPKLGPPNLIRSLARTAYVLATWILVSGRLRTIGSCQESYRGFLENLH